MRVWIALVALSAIAQDWPSYGGDAGHQKYSPIKQITRANVAKLQVAWTHHNGDISDGKTTPVRTAFEATPLMIDGVLYVTTAYSRLLAIDAENGKELWAFDPKVDHEQPNNLYVNRGAAYWTDGKSRRLFFGTIDARLFSIDAATGEPDPAFGAKGVINLATGYADKWPGKPYGMTSPPAIYKNVVICGALASDGEPKGPSGDIRGLDARTGKELWRFHTVPRPGEFGHDTWQPGTTEDRGGANVWSMMSVDPVRGLVFLPLTSPSHDYYGGDRKGANLFGDAIVALDAATGKRRWHFQTVHHNIWDYDLPSAPVLVDVMRKGRKVAAVAQATKTGWVFVLDRETGKPMFDVEERKVPASEVPGEEAHATQPFPVKPPPVARQIASLADMHYFDDQHRADCEAITKDAVFGSLFTPIGLKTTILFPGTNGGVNWGGGSFDPETRTFYVNSMDNGMTFRLTKRPDGAIIPYRVQGARSPNSRFWDRRRWPCQKPPWGQLTAVNLDTGEFRWQSVLGVVDELVARGVAPTGTSNLGGSLVTAGGLLFIGATNDSRFRAFDKDTGKELWTVKLPASAHATPMTYVGKKSGKQFVVIAAGGGNKYNDTFSDSLVAYSLP